jgi:flagellar basal-body rod protein FlgC
MFDSLDISASGLQAQRVRMDSIAQNVASIGKSSKGAPYRRKFTVFHEGRPDDPSKPGVRAQVKDESAFYMLKQPGHPDADKDGNVKYPQIDMAVEMVNMLEASRAYEANVTTMDVTKSMFNSSLRLLA